jgi:hypothetical protein
VFAFGAAQRRWGGPRLSCSRDSTSVVRSNMGGRRESAPVNAML